MKVSLLGFGVAGEYFHAPLIAATAGLELTTIVTGDAARGARAALAYPGTLITDDADAVWSADLVVVAAPNRFHASYAHEAVARGVAVVIDKPLATSLADVDAVLHDAAAHHSRLTVFQNRRWDGDFLTAQQLVADGTLGEITRFTSTFARFRPAVREGWRESADARDGGGQLLDLGPHLIDQALLLLGPARTVYAEIDRRRPGAGTDDEVFVALEHVSGARSHLTMSTIAPVPLTRMAVAGTRGGFASADLDVQESQLRAGLSPTDPSFGRNPPGTVIDEAGARDHPMQPGAYLDFYAAVPAWLQGGPPPVDPHDTRAVFAVIEAARESAITHRVVAPGSGH